MTNSREGSCDKNPDGACYPTLDTGTSARNGMVEGNRIQNFRFEGYEHTDVTTVAPVTGMGVVQLADFFDPTAKKYTIIHLSVAAAWCGPCNQETEAIKGPNGFAAKLAQSGVVFLQALGDGMLPGKGATRKDLDDWINLHQSNFTEFLDGVPNNKLGVFFDAAAMPFNANIDARSMEILSAGVGFNPMLDQEIQVWVDWTKSNPAKQ